MNQDIQNKLIALRETYLKSLPNKVMGFEKLWSALQEQWDPAKLIEFHRLVHSLHGSAGTYGLTELGEASAHLEIFLRSLFEAVPSKEQVRQIDELLQIVKETALETPNPKPPLATSVKSGLETNNTVYLYQRDEGEMQKLSSELTSYGYLVEPVTDMHMLPFLIRRQWPLALLIDIDLLNSELAYTLQSIREQDNSKTLSIFFLARNGDFNERLKSVRMKGRGYFTRPLLVDEVVDKLEQLQNSDHESYQILIVEDETDLAEYYSLLLQHAGMRVKVITQPKLIDHALIEFKPDLILMDIYMPECTGLELATLIRQQNAYEGVPIVFLSAEEDKRKQLNALSLGADDFMTKSIEPEHLIQAVRTKAKRYKKIRATMVKDALTGVFNHSAIINMLDLEVKSASRLNSPLTVVMIDLDHFKLINDNYGHLTGDQVLKHLCLLLGKRLRASDLIGRFGGEEFLLVMPNTTMEDAKSIIDTLRIKFSEINFMANNQVFHSTFSAGLASFPECKTSLGLIQAADDTLYKAKQLGRNMVLLSNI